MSEPMTQADNGTRDEAWRAMSEPIPLSPEEEAEIRRDFGSPTTDVYWHVAIRRLLATLDHERSFTLVEQQCPDCAGYGYTTDADPLPSGEPGAPYQVPCGTCGTTGRVVVRDPEREAAARALPGVEQAIEAVKSMQGFTPSMTVGGYSTGFGLEPSPFHDEADWLQRGVVLSALAALPPDSRAERLEAAAAERERLTKALRAIVDGAEHIDGDPLSYENIERARAALAPAAPVQEDSQP